MDLEIFLDALRSAPGYAGQVVYVHETPARAARFAHDDVIASLPEGVRRALRSRGIERLYTHQAEALARVRAGEDVVVVSGTASGKSLCYLLPILEMLHRAPHATALLLFPTKALCQDQFRNFARMLETIRHGKDAKQQILAGVYDGDTPSAMRRRLRDGASVLFTNPDMLHAAILPQHARWAGFLSRLRVLVLDELHVYGGIFGSNMANLLRRFERVRRHDAQPGEAMPHRPQPTAAVPHTRECRIIACSATVGNPKELAERLIGRPVALIDDDGSPRGRRIYCLWNPPRLRATAYRSRRSANVEAHELMAMLIRRGVPTITFSKAKMTAEMIHRYVVEALRRDAPHLAAKVSPYRGGYLPEERREIERRLFSGELLGVSTTRALELGIDVGGLDASIIVGYPGTLASFFQQSGRAGRQGRDALVVLIGLDTAINQYIMTHPEYLFGRPVEEAVVEPDGPFVLLNHLRCAAHELPLADDELARFGPNAGTVLRVLEQEGKVARIEGRWYHAASETPQHEISLRAHSDANVTIQDADTGAVIGELDKFDAPPIVHPGAIYLHQGDTYRVLSLDLDRRLCTVKREDVDYYTQPLGGTDVHHVDRLLREKAFGAGRACWGEVTVYDQTWGYEKVRFYSLDTFSQHRVDLPRQAIETAALWIVPPDDLLERVRAAGLDAHGGLRGIGYAVRMALPLFMTCDTLDFSHSVGSANSEWSAVFVWERIAHGLGFTRHAYERLHEILPAVLDHIRRCGCEAGCPCCVGKPLRPYATWNVERGEASIPSKASALMILEGLLGDGTRLAEPDTSALSDDAEAERLRLEEALRRRLQRMREPEVFHPIEPAAATRSLRGGPGGGGRPEGAESGAENRDDGPRTTDAGRGLSSVVRRPSAPSPPSDVAARAAARREFEKDLHKRLAKKTSDGRLSPFAGKPAPPPGMAKPGANLPPTAFPGRPATTSDAAPGNALTPPPRAVGDPLAAKARRLVKRRDAPDASAP